MHLLIIVGTTIAYLFFEMDFFSNDDRDREPIKKCRNQHHNKEDLELEIFIGIISRA
jgi:hypothetical protein